MRYNIRMSMGYQYAMPSDRVRALVRLLPSDLIGRQIVSARLLSIRPRPGERHDGSDFFGNAMSALAFHHPIERIDLKLEARVERIAPPPSLDLSPNLDGLACEVAAHTGLQAFAPHHFLGPSVRVAPDPSITAFARDQIGAQMTTMQIVEAIGSAINGAMRFDANATHVDTPPAEAFMARHGVCQDFTHIMIAALRALGIPSGYVSGFLRTIPPPGQPRLEGADAMHAWASAWCGSENGWVEYDPTNACFVGLDHVAVAYGRDYSDVSPLKGVLRTVGEQESHHTVDVEPL